MIPCAPILLVQAQEISGVVSAGIQTGGIAGGVGTTIQVLQAGQPVNSFFVYQHRESGGKVVSTGPDTAMYVDVNGDKIINTSDLRAFHSPAPKWILGHTSNMSWRNFDAATVFMAFVILPMDATVFILVLTVFSVEPNLICISKNGNPPRRPHCNAGNAKNDIKNVGRFGDD